MPSEVGHVALMPHEALIAVAAPEGKVPRVPAAVPHQLVSVPEHLLAELTGEP